MSVQPLGIADLLTHDIEKCGSRCTLGDHWYWCRRHEQAHKVGEVCHCTCPAGKFLHPHQHSAGCPAETRCKDVGPFMSQREANRLGGSLFGPGNKPLGMEIEL